MAFYPFDYFNNIRIKKYYMTTRIIILIRHVLKKPDNNRALPIIDTRVTIFLFINLIVM